LGKEEWIPILFFALPRRGIFSMLYLKAFGAFYDNGDNLDLEDD
jgi:hypothetical protein